MGHCHSQPQEIPPGQQLSALLRAHSPPVLQLDPLEQPGPLLLSRLADVELQLIMHGLEGHELIQLARVNRRLLHTADCSFAWKHSLLRVHSGDRIFRLAPLPRLLQHAAVCVRCDIDPTSEESAAALLLVVLNSGARVHGLDGVIIPKLLTKEQQQPWRDVLAHPTMQQLQTMRVSKSIDVGMMDLLCALPALHTLSFRDVSDAAVFALLPRCAALTSFSGGVGGVSGQALLASVVACTQLKKLDLSAPRIADPPSFEAFFASPHIQQLQSMRIHWFRQRWEKRVTPAGYIAAFSSLRVLHTLHLVSWFAINELLPHLACVPSLRHLTLQPDCVEKLSGRETSSVPSRLVMQSLLAAAPQLHCLLVLRPNLPPLISSWEWIVVLWAARQFVAPMGPRFCIRSEFPE